MFLKQWTPRCVGDYANKTNHVLLTNGYAQMNSKGIVRLFLKIHDDTIFDERRHVKTQGI